MTRDQALNQAIKQAKHFRQWRYVIYEPDDISPPARCFYSASLSELETFYSGFEPTYVISPDGEVQ